MLPVTHIQTTNCTPSAPFVGYQWAFRLSMPGRPWHKRWHPTWLAAINYEDHAPSNYVVATVDSIQFASPNLRLRTKRSCLVGLFGSVLEGLVIVDTAESPTARVMVETARYVQSFVPFPWRFPQAMSPRTSFRGP